ncbi:hypothetical protein [Methanospirillum lacunae]|uniref:Uncharacterized protein n=1 Tax=Methanospirillum lacunae TaxID=668570 RepID=A0A2V2N1X2_9EURY|nr:hypothetical protein [Methanospirillum lacunae]PWR74334.1 hypothetical protein DK846_04080 [Methanospirillum lacunae]
MKSKEKIPVKEKKTLKAGVNPAQESVENPDAPVQGPIENAKTKGKKGGTDGKNKKIFDLAQMKANQMSSNIRIKAHQVLAGNRKK